jgi:predicted regulator of Ras-like GTPase activity (Roadblock/LC7/MglB family)
MVNAVSPNPGSDLGWLLSSLAEEAPQTRGVVLLSSDGLMKASYGLDTASAEQLAALACSLFAVARSAGAKFDHSDQVRQVVAELHDSQLFISWAGFNSVLAVLATGKADAAVVGFEMSRLIKAVRPFLDTAARSASVVPGDPAR